MNEWNLFRFTLAAIEQMYKLKVKIANLQGNRKGVGRS